MSSILRVASPRSDIAFVQPTLYLPASSAGSPGISPAYDTNFWDNTASAARVVARIGKKYGTTFETITLTGNSGHFRRLARQFVCPLSDIGLATPASPHPQWVFTPVNFKVRVGTLGTEICPWAIFRIVNSSGADIDSFPTKSGITFTAGSATMVGSGFSAGDVGKAFVVENHDNIMTAGGNRPGVNQIASFTNSTHVVMFSDYPAASDVIGSGRTIRFVNQDGKPQMWSSGSFASTSDVVAYAQEYVIAPARRIFGRAHYLVIEIGCQIVNLPGTTNRNFRMSFGDPSNSTLDTDPTNGSSGGPTTLSAHAPFISLSF